MNRTTLSAIRFNPQIAHRKLRKMKLLTIDLHQQITTLKDSKFNEHTHWFFDVAFQLDLEEVIAFQKSGVKLPDLSIDSKGVASLKSISGVNSYPGETRSRDVEKTSAYSLLSERFCELQEQIERTSEYALLRVYKSCKCEVDSLLERMKSLIDEVNELQEEYRDYRTSLVDALSLRENLTDMQVKGLFGELDTLSLEYVDRQMSRI